MNRTLPVCAALAAVAVIANALPAPAPPPAGDCQNIFLAEPLVVYDVSGFSLGGAIHRHLAVYNNGLVSISAASGLPGAVAGAADFEFLPVSEVNQFARDLYLAGAWNICDEFVPISDLPLSTVTVLRGATTGPSHTYSYFVPESPEAQAVGLLLQEFIAEHFPGY